MMKNKYIAPEVEVMELEMQALLENASPVPVDITEDAEGPGLSRPFDNMPIFNNN